nr:MAG TPA: hypothetical protein [Caudoviricetes sp.]
MISWFYKKVRREATLLGPLRHGKVLNPFRLKKSIDLGSALSI